MVGSKARKLVTRIRIRASGEAIQESEPWMNRLQHCVTSPRCLAAYFSMLKEARGVAYIRSFQKAANVMAA